MCLQRRFTKTRSLLSTCLCVCVCVCVCVFNVFMYEVHTHTHTSLSAYPPACNNSKTSEDELCGELVYWNFVTNIRKTLHNHLLAFVLHFDRSSLNSLSVEAEMPWTKAGVNKKTSSYVPDIFWKRKNCYAVDFLTFSLIFKLPASYSQKKKKFQTLKNSSNGLHLYTFVVVMWMWQGICHIRNDCKGGLCPSELARYS